MSYHGDTRKRGVEKGDVEYKGMEDINNNARVKMNRTDDMDVDQPSSSQGVTSYGSEQAEMDDLEDSKRAVALDPLDAGPFIPSVMARKPEKGKLQRGEQPLRLFANMYAMESAVKKADMRYIYKYNIVIEPQDPEKGDKHIQKRGEDDHARTHKREACHQLFLEFVRRNVGKLNRRALVYDRNTSLNSLVKFDDLPIVSQDIPHYDEDNKTEAKYTVSLVEPKEGALKWDMSDTSNVTNEDLAERDRMFEQFTDLLTSQSSFDELVLVDCANS